MKPYNKAILNFSLYHVTQNPLAAVGHLYSASLYWLLKSLSLIIITYPLTNIFLCSIFFLTTQLVATTIPPYTSGLGG